MNQQSRKNCLACLFPSLYVSYHTITYISVSGFSHAYFLCPNLDWLDFYLLSRKGLFHVVYCHDLSFVCYFHDNRLGYYIWRKNEAQKKTNVECNWKPKKRTYNAIESLKNVWIFISYSFCHSQRASDEQKNKKRFPFCAQVFYEKTIPSSNFPISTFPNRN